MRFGLLTGPVHFHEQDLCGGSGADGRVTLSGRVDRVDELPDGTLAVID